MATNANNHHGHCDLDFSGPNLAFLMLATIHDPPSHDLYVDYRLPSPLFWLQLLTNLLVVVILILVVQVLHCAYSCIDPLYCDLDIRGLGCNC